MCGAFSQHCCEVWQELDRAFPVNSISSSVGSQDALERRATHCVDGMPSNERTDPAGRRASAILWVTAACNHEGDDTESSVLDDIK